MPWTLFGTIHEPHPEYVYAILQKIAFKKQGELDG
jgi:hypothetical protein